MKTLETATDMELLSELLSRNNIEQGTVSSTYSSSVRDCVIGIGNDNTATIRLHTDDIEALNELTSGEPQ